ncbi:SDR family oxidoreductase [Trichothermofontia sichuanensis B231]|uniref:SDR family oxidoreductase n=1 Tax=Trichothermofontia sichuanensis TaxID=3045816 RepID=UPI0022481072|nr:SDR family oxidoreductase [Trichothermofontia sichuanensis]UZQ53853.1 SDR family oxidoreductase [Trichothermofontia sichuanensis B231]
MTTQPLIFLAGASRGVGREIALRLVANPSYRVKALLRSEAARPDLEAIGLTVVMGDALDPVAIAQAMQGDSIAAVISTIGGLPQEGQRSDYLGNRNLIDAAVAAGVGQFILVSSIGSGNSAVALAPHILEALRPVLIEKDKAEQHLIASGLTYTIIRPGGLKSEPATGNGVLIQDPTIAGSIHRADVADLVCRCLQAPPAFNQVFSAVDRQMLYGTPDLQPVVW